MWLFEYSVTYYDEDAPSKSLIANGVVPAASYAEAMRTLEEYYGDELVRVNKLFCCTEDLYEFNNDESEFKVHLYKAAET